MIDGTLQTIDGRPALRFERHLAHSVQRVWRAVTEPSELAQWFVAPVPWTPMLGETFEGDGQAGAITALEEPTLLRWEWGDERYAFELTEHGDGCVLVFTHAFGDRDTAARTAAGWDRCVARLEALLAEQPMSEADSLELWPVVHERYAERFGVDPEIGRRAYAAHPQT